MRILFISAILIASLILAIPSTSGLNYRVSASSFELVRGTVTVGALNDTFIDDSNVMNVTGSLVESGSSDVVTLPPNGDLFHNWVANGCGASVHYQCVDDAGFPASASDGDTTNITPAFNSTGTVDEFSFQDEGGLDPAVDLITKIEIFLSVKRNGTSPSDLGVQGLSNFDACMETTYRELPINYTTISFSSATCGDRDWTIEDVTKFSVRVSYSLPQFYSPPMISAIAIQVTIKPIEYWNVIDYTFRIAGATAVPQSVDWVCSSDGTEIFGNVFDVLIYDRLLEQFEPGEEFTACDNTLHSFGGLDIDNNVKSAHPPFAPNTPGGNVVVRFMSHSPLEQYQFNLSIDYASVVYDFTGVKENDFSWLVLFGLISAATLFVAWRIYKWREGE